MRGIFRMLGRGKEPLKPRPKIEGKQTKLEDFNIGNSNNTNVMEYLDVDKITFKEDGVYDEKG